MANQSMVFLNRLPLPSAPGTRTSRKKNSSGRAQIRTVTVTLGSGWNFFRAAAFGRLGMGPKDFKMLTKVISSNFTRCGPHKKRKFPKSYATDRTMVTSTPYKPENSHMKEIYVGKIDKHACCQYSFQAAKFPDAKRLFRRGRSCLSTKRSKVAAGKPQRTRRTLKSCGAWGGQILEWGRPWRGPSRPVVSLQAPKNRCLRAKNEGVVPLD